jgi:hypothetical protein
MSTTLASADGLGLICDTPHWRVAWGEADWLGPVLLRSAGELIEPELRRVTDGADELGAFVRAEVEGLAAPLHTSVRAYRNQALLVFRLETDAELCSFGSSTFADVSLAWPALQPSQRTAGGIAPGTRTYGHQYSEFALPVSGGDAATGFLFAPHRPAIVEPLLFVAPDGRTLLLAPLDQFHEQIIAVPRDVDHEADGMARRSRGCPSRLRDRALPVGRCIAARRARPLGPNAVPPSRNPPPRALCRRRRRQALVLDG